MKFAEFVAKNGTTVRAHKLARKSVILTLNGSQTITKGDYVIPREDRGDVMDVVSEFAFEEIFSPSTNNENNEKKVSK